MPILAHLTIAAALCACPPDVLPADAPVDATPTAPAPAPKPPCEGDVVLVQLDGLLPCDVIPPQMLVLVMDDDPGPVQEQDCHDSGGRVMHDPAADRFYCLDIDY